MSDPGFARPDLCSIRIADEQDELAEAVRGEFSAEATRWAMITRPHPFTSDIGLVYATSMVGWCAVPALGAGSLLRLVAARVRNRGYLTANMIQGWSHGLLGAVVVAWSAVSLVGSYKLLVWLTRTCWRWQ